jgi:hypothetical protein
MSLHLDFEPHSWYMHFAIRKVEHGYKYSVLHQRWQAFTDNGNTYRVDELNALTISDLRQKIRDYHKQREQRIKELYERLEVKQ